MNQIINSAFLIIHILMMGVMLMVFIAKFLKKKTFLSKLKLDGENVSFCLTIWFFIDFMLLLGDTSYERYDRNQTGLTSGASLSIVLLVIIALGTVGYKLYQWHKSLPDT